MLLLGPIGEVPVSGESIWLINDAAWALAWLADASASWFSAALSVSVRR